MACTRALRTRSFSLMHTHAHTYPRTIPLEACTMAISPHFNGLPISHPHSSSLQGSGLGLYICKRLVTQMHGRLGAERLESGGSNIWFAVKFRRTATPALTPSRLALQAQLAQLDIAVVASQSGVRMGVEKSFNHLGLRYQFIDRIKDLTEVRQAR